MRGSGISALFLALSLVAMAQSPAPKFEVVSVKVSQSPFEMMRAGKMPGGLVFSGNRVDVGSVALKNLIATAYRTEIPKISVPDWTTQAFFSLQAVMPEGATKEQYPDMLRAMLEDRFHLVSHKETKDQAAYLLTLAKGGHKNEAGP